MNATNNYLNKTLCRDIWKFISLFLVNYPSKCHTFDSFFSKVMYNAMLNHNLQLTI